MDKYYRGKVIVSKREKYDGETFAHLDIVLEQTLYLSYILFKKFEKYRVVQDRLFESDFDKFLLNMKKEDCIK